MSKSDLDLVVLAGGLSIPREALHTIIDLEVRGVRLELGEGDALFARPRALLTDADRAAVARWRQPIRAILAYQAPTPAWLH